MKKSVIIITVSIFSFTGFTAMAQSAADRKPKIDEAGKTIAQDKTPAVALEPQIVPAAKVMKVEEQSKPIVPGGEFKPMDTNKPAATASMKSQTTDNNQPVIPAVKKAGPPPVVTEIKSDPAVQDRAKPAPVKLIEQ